MRSLVIVYSNSGNTLTVAKTIKKELKAHLREITDYTIHRTVLDYLFTSAIDSASINPRKIDVDYYETIFIGTPVWLGSVTPAIKKIIDNTDFKNKNVILFNTLKCIGGDIAMKRLARQVKKHNGNVIGGFSIYSNGTKEDMINNTRIALSDFNLV
ncbi:flavodoxin [Candidatus Methanosphaera massiliense]|uniref:flavodoxin family protein n=1 Tax=Candidatus Methanosphaera massiliense TaxID=3017187 RepID=UPI0023808F1D|nr:NAD(P)H-dependent oxidoreductase [Candidatus Methanosphaera massiliense]MDE4078823.1 NAD(P)H-dependent oxidoreductase [Candidatus Methanosphaera massiliense]